MQAMAGKESVEIIVAAINGLDLESIKFRLTHPQAGKGWSMEMANRIEREYKRFLTLLVRYPDKPIAPTHEVDEMWHQHILDTRKYATDCENVFGRFLHHYPYLGLQGED